MSYKFIEPCLALQNDELHWIRLLKWKMKHSLFYSQKVLQMHSFLLASLSCSKVFTCNRSWKDLRRRKLLKLTRIPGSNTPPLYKLKQYWQILHRVPKRLVTRERTLTFQFVGFIHLGSFVAPLCYGGTMGSRSNRTAAKVSVTFEIFSQSIRTSLAQSVAALCNFYL